MVHHPLCVNVLFRFASARGRLGADSTDLPDEQGEVLTLLLDNLHRYESLLDF